MRNVLIAAAAGLLLAGVSVAGAQTRLQPSGQQPTTSNSAASDCGMANTKDSGPNNAQPCNPHNVAPNPSRRPNGTRE